MFDTQATGRDCTWSSMLGEIYVQSRIDNVSANTLVSLST
jgi:hypothetical protein